jgi:hypothetical protein
MGRWQGKNTLLTTGKNLLKILLKVFRGFLLKWKKEIKRPTPKWMKDLTYERKKS